MGRVRLKLVLDERKGGMRADPKKIDEGNLERLFMYEEQIELNHLVGLSEEDNKCVGRSNHRRRKKMSANICKNDEKT